jgi:imidazolonepropionase-like amidohydrolase
MGKKIFLLLMVCFWPTCASISQATEANAYLHEGPVLLSNISVIDGLGHTAAPMRDVFIQHGRIARIAVTGMIEDLPEDIRRINGNGLTLMPGLIDAHVHIGNIGFKPGEFERKDLPGMDRSLRAHLYAGVTSVLELGGDMEKSIQLRDEIASGSRLGPTIYTVGATIQALEMPKSAFELPNAETRKEIKTLLDAREARGIEIIKLYVGITPWEARHIMVEAKKRNMRGIADFWCTNLSRTVFEVALIDSYAHGGCREITQEEAKWMHDNGKFAIVTLSVFETMGGQRAFADYPVRGFLKNPLIVDVLGRQTIEDYYTTFPMLRESFEEGEDSLYNSQHFPNLAQLLPDNMHNVKLLHEEGVIVGMGTDSAFPPGTWPGEAMHRELELHVQSGISPIDAIRMATMNNAILLRRDHEIGSIDKGKIADLLIVDGDPSTNISDTRNIVHVFKGGRLIDRTKLKRP